MTLYALFVLTACIMSGGSFLLMIFMYFMLVVYFVMSCVLGGGGISPYMFLLLFSGGMLVFLLFCSLLNNNKIFFHTTTFLYGLIMPVFLLVCLNPLHVPILSFSFNFNPLHLLTVPSILLFIMSIGNLEVALRN
uniref:NADH dehydrogenase subunit 6 n=1 Tax=Salpa younti TaxID=2072449 RepID=A0AA86IRY5_9UROC|nr:NADH dehydrogenase subunit 6 [Salpa younti]